MMYGALGYSPSVDQLFRSHVLSVEFFALVRVGWNSCEFFCGHVCSRKSEQSYVRCGQQLAPVGETSRVTASVVSNNSTVSYIGVFRRFVESSSL